MREIERNEIILHGEIDVRVFPAYTLNAEVICRIAKAQKLPN